MACPKCRSEVSYVPIIKGNKVIGVNFFCMRMNCNYEVDKKLKRENATNSIN